MSCLVQRACVEEEVPSEFHLALWGIGDLRLAGSGRSLLVSLANFQGHPHAPCPRVCVVELAFCCGRRVENLAWFNVVLVIVRSKARLCDSMIMPRHVQGPVQDDTRTVKL